VNYDRSLTAGIAGTSSRVNKIELKGSMGPIMGDLQVFLKNDDPNVETCACSSILTVLRLEADVDFEHDSYITTECGRTG
jgi:hypothetical protein